MNFPKLIGRNIEYNKLAVLEGGAEAGSKVVLREGTEEAAEAAAEAAAKAATKNAAEAAVRAGAKEAGEAGAEAGAKSAAKNAGEAGAKAGAKNAGEAAAKAAAKEADEGLKLVLKDGVKDPSTYEKFGKKLGKSAEAIKDASKKADDAWKAMSPLKQKLIKYGVGSAAALAALCLATGKTPEELAKSLADAAGDVIDTGESLFDKVTNIPGAISDFFASMGTPIKWTIGIIVLLMVLALVSKFF